MSSLLHDDRAKSRPTNPSADYLSFEEFLDRFPDAHVEWVNGRVVPMAPIDDAHADLSDFLIALLRHWAQDRGLGIVRSEPVLMKTGPDMPGRSPDVLFVSKDNVGRVKRTYIDGPADLVVEIISLESVARDRREKFAEYQSGGVREYWLIDPRTEQADFYQLGEDRTYHAVAPDEQGVYRSAVPGLWLRVEWLWKRPSVLSVLREWKLV